MSHKIFVCLFAIASLFISSSSFAQVLAVVGDEKISLDEFQKKYAEVKQQTINAPEPSLFLEDLIRYKIGVQEARKKNLQNDPIVQERFQQELYKVLVEKAIGDEVNKIRVSEKEMKNYYKNNPEFRTSHILIEFKPDASSEEKASAKKRALEIYSEVRKSKRPFEELVKLYTDDTLSKNTGGDIGYQSKVTLVPPYYDTVRKMKINEVKGLVETQYGYHIIKLTGRRSYQEANKRQIRAAVFDQKRKQIFDRYFVSLKKKYKINVNKSALRKVQ